MNLQSPFSHLNRCNRNRFRTLAALLLLLGLPLSACGGGEGANREASQTGVYLVSLELCEGVPGSTDCLEENWLVWGPPAAESGSGDFQPTVSAFHRPTFGHHPAESYYIAVDSHGCYDDVIEEETSRQERGYYYNSALWLDPEHWNGRKRIDFSSDKIRVEPMDAERLEKMETGLDLSGGIWRSPACERITDRQLEKVREGSLEN